MKKYQKSLICLLVGAASLSMVGCGTSNKISDQENYRQYGIRCMESGEYEEAAGAFQLGLDQSKGTVGEMELDLCYYKAEALYLNGDLDGAKEVYDAIIAYNRDAQAYYLRGCLYYKRGMREEALTDYALALQKDSRNYELYINVAQSLLAYGETEGSTYYLNEALAIKGSKGSDNLYKGRIYYLLGQYDEAVTKLQKASEQGEVKAGFYLAQVYATLGDTQQSEASFQKYLDSGEVCADELCKMGDAQLLNGEYDAAITYLTAALDMEGLTMKQTALKDLVIAYEKIYDFEHAGQYMSEYVALFPEDEEAQREYLFLQTR